MGAEHPLDPAIADRELRNAVRELARRVAELEGRSGDAVGALPAHGLSDDKLARVAASLYRARRLRAKYFDASLIEEPAWDMLLDLFVSAVRGVRVATTSLCLAARVPQATGLRWIAVLLEQGLVRRYQAEDDHRVRPVEITPKGFRLMRQYLSDSVTRFDRPLAD